jgi:hypothetical protein
MLTPSKLVLGFVAACVAAVSTVELAVLGEANPVIRLAQGAILNARAAFLGLIANQATKFFEGHRERLTFRIESPVRLLSRQAPIKSNRRGHGEPCARGCAAG